MPDQADFKLIKHLLHIKINLKVLLYVLKLLNSFESKRKYIVTTFLLVMDQDHVWLTLLFVTRSYLEQVICLEEFQRHSNHED